MNAYQRYRKKTIVNFQLALNRNTDKDILKWLDDVPNMAGAVKAAIRAAIREQVPENTPENTPEQVPENISYTYKVQNGKAIVPEIDDNKPLYAITYDTKKGGDRPHKIWISATNAKSAVKDFRKWHSENLERLEGHAFHVEAKRIG